MSTTTVAEAQLLRIRPHISRLNLSIYRPSTILACKTTGSPIKGSRSISYDTVSVGNYANVKNGMTMLIGTSAGLADMGKIRVRGATATALTVAENSDIAWTNGLFLTVLDFFEIWPVFQYLEQSGEDVTIYKDYDIAYTDQNKYLGSTICMGSHYAGFMPPVGGLDIYYSATGTYNLSEDDLTYAWEFPGSTSTGSNAYDPGYIHYDVPGHYTTSLTVTSSNGAVDTSYRHISIYNKSGQGDVLPPRKWGIENLSGSRDEGGYTARIWTYADDPKEIIDGSLIVIFAEDQYGSTKQSIGGNSTGRESIVFTGYIKTNSISYDYQSSKVEFDVVSPSIKAKSVSGFSISVDNVATDPTSWFYLKDLTCHKAVYHYLRWHSTVLMCNDFAYRGTDFSILNITTNRQSIYDAAQSFMDNALAGNIVSDRQGKTWAETSVAATDNAAAVLPNTFKLNKWDWMGSLEIGEAQEQVISYMEVGGVQYDGSSTGTNAYLCCVPGTAPAAHGTTSEREGLALSSQEQLNQLAGNLFAYSNARFPSVQMMLSGNYRNLDIAPNEIIRLTIYAQDTNSDIEWNEKAFHITDMDLSYDPESAVLLPSLVLHEVTQGNTGDTIVIPPMPPTENPNIPPIPPIPPVEPPVVPPGIPTGTSNICFAVGYQYDGVYVGTGTTNDADITHYHSILARTDTFNSASPSWTRMTSEFVSGIFRDFRVDPYNPTSAGYFLTTYGLWYIDNMDTVTPTSTQLLSHATANSMATGTSLDFYEVLPSLSASGSVFISAIVAGDIGLGVYYDAYVFSKPPGGVWQASIACEVTNPDRGVAFVVDRSNSNNIYVGGVSAGVQLMYKSTDAGITWNPRTGPLSHFFGFTWVTFPNGTADLAYVVWGSDSANDAHIGKYLNDFTSGTYVDLSPVETEDGFSRGGGNFPLMGMNVVAVCRSSPTTLYALANKSMDKRGKEFQFLYKSTNGGTSWTKIGQFLGYVRMLIVDPYVPTTLYMGGGVNVGELLFSTDGGTNWQEKMGDWQSKFDTEPMPHGIFPGNRDYAWWDFNRPGASLHPPYPRS